MAGGLQRAVALGVELRPGKAALAPFVLLSFLFVRSANATAFPFSEPLS